MRLIWIFLGLAAFMLVPFFIWAESMDFGPDGAIGYLEGFGSWAWAVGVGLLLSDLMLPIPGTAIMAALGYIYGFWLGGLISAIGSFLAGSTAFLLCRALGRRAAIWLVGEEDLAKGERIFTSIGGWLVVISRWLPLFPEVIACMAGLVGMPPRLFFLALACGSVPLGFAYAAIGAAGIDRPALALALSAGLPPLLWWIVKRRIESRIGDLVQNAEASEKDS
ncbi:MAG: DedA family protein [Verrucomicrobiales bacterium]|nr:DedA family protein [Verrucomicrobiales bacterium]|tara:strand:+ start:6259 stop:6924 length:666 start_codon:yes stop_codon:yes gene_type:complete